MIPDRGGQTLPAVCYVVPSWRPDDTSHMAHLPRFLTAVARYCDLHVVVQRGWAPPIHDARSVYVQRAISHPARFVELLRVALRLKRQGCRRFFVRISSSAAFELGILGRLAGLRVYWWTSGQGHDMRPPWRVSPRRRMANALRRVLFRTNAALVHRFVTGPESMVEYYRNELGIDARRTIVLYNDVPMVEESTLTTRERARAELGLPPNALIVLFVGRVSRLKGGQNLVPIAVRLADRCPDALLAVVGSLDHLPHVPEEAAQRGLRNVLFRGSLPNHQLGLFYRAADVFILPSESEGFPRVLVEAMAHGVPVVPCDVGGVRDILHPLQMPFVVPRGDMDGLVAKVVELLEDPEARATQAAAGRATVERFSTDSVARMFVERIVTDPSVGIDR